MSNNDSLDEETKRLLAEVETDDSDESKSKKRKSYETVWETNSEDTDDSEW